MLGLRIVYLFIIKLIISYCLLNIYNLKKLYQNLEQKCECLSKILKSWVKLNFNTLNKN